MLSQNQYFDQTEENMKGLHDYEIEFLDLVDGKKLAADRKKEIEEEMELNDYRNRVASLQEKTLEEKLLAEVAVNKPKITPKVRSQQTLFKGIVVKKNDSQKRKSDDTESEKKSKQQKTDAIVNMKSSDNGEDKKETIATSEPTEFAKEQVHIEVPSSGLKCIGILPGLGCYTESTSDEDSSSSESEAETTNIKYDLLGRKVINKIKEKNV